jgi:hypothetical protein
VAVAPPDLHQYILDGRYFHGLSEFFDAVGAALGTKGWGRNLDAFNDILRGGFGTPDRGFVLRWTYAELSAERLGREETVQFLEQKLTTCHPDNIAHVKEDLQAARRQEGQTLFEIIIQVIREHGPGGREAQDNVHLILQ